MKQPLRQVKFYKRALQAGCARGFSWDEELCLHLAAGEEGSWFAAFDTADEDGTYNRLVVDGDFSGAKLEVLAAAGPAGPELAAFLASDAPDEEKRAALTALPGVRQVNRQDLLLHSLSGRWAFLCLRAAAGDTPCVLRGLRLEFPKYSFTRYFPEIYQQDEFFDRYIAVFQSLYLDLEARVDEVPALLDYESAPDEQVRRLAGWLGMDDAGGLFGPDQLREMIRHSALYQGGKGTRAALESAVELACGVRPRIVETFRWARLPLSAERRRLYGRLYGDDAGTFCVLLDLTNRTGPLPVSQARLEELIDAYSPLGTRHKLVLVRPCSYTDTHCYLGVNSCLSTPEKAAVDGVRLGGYYTVG